MLRRDCDEIIEIVIAKYLEANMIKVAKEAKEEAKEIMEAKEGVMGRKIELKKINEATSKK